MRLASEGSGPLMAWFAGDVRLFQATPGQRRTPHFLSMGRKQAKMGGKQAAQRLAGLE